MVSRKRANKSKTSRRAAIFYCSADYQFAARELASYIEKITGERPSLVKNPARSPGSRNVFVIGPPSDNAIASELDESHGGSISKALSEPQSFVVWPIERGQTRYVVLAGQAPVTTLYAVYGYLELDYLRTSTLLKLIFSRDSLEILVEDIVNKDILDTGKMRISEFELEEGKLSICVVDRADF